MTIGEAYAVLGLDAASTTPVEARSRFRDLIRLNHPDGKPSHEQARANETTRVLVEACTLLRTEGFPRAMACNGMADAGGHRFERQAAAEPGFADPLAWIDEVWLECIRSSPVDIVSPAFSIRFAVDAWMMGWRMIRGNRRKVD